MPQHDRGRDRHGAGVQRDDLALAGGGQRRDGAADEGVVAGILCQRRAALALPAAGLQRQKGLQRRGDVGRFARDREADLALVGQPCALAAQFLQLLGAEPVA